MELARGLDETVYIIGGGEIYKVAMPYTTHLDLTLVEADAPDAEIFFPEYEMEFKEISRSEPVKENGIRYSFATFEKK